LSFARFAGWLAAGEIRFARVVIDGEVLHHAAGERPQPWAAQWYVVSLERDALA